MTDPTLKENERNFLYATLIAADPDYITVFSSGGGTSSSEKFSQLPVPQNITNQMTNSIFYNMLKPERFKFLEHNSKLAEQAAAHKMDVEQLINLKYKQSPEYKNYIDTMYVIQKTFAKNNVDMSYVDDVMLQGTALYRQRMFKQEGTAERLADLSYQPPRDIYDAWAKSGDQRFRQARPLRGEMIGIE